MTEVLSAKTFLRKRYLEKAVGVLDEIDLDVVVDALERLYRPVLLPDQEMPDWRFLIQLERQLLAAMSTNVVGADQERRDCSRSRRKGSSVARQRAKMVRRVLWQMANDIEAVYGTEVKDLLGLKGKRPGNPELALDLGVLIRGRLRGSWFTFPEATLDDYEALDREELASRLDRPILLLEEALGVRTSKRESADSALDEKKEQQEQAHQGRLVVVGRLRLLFKLLKLGRIAQRLDLPVPKSRAQAEEQDGSDGGDVGSDGGDVGSDGGDVGSDGGDVGSDGGDVGSDGGDVGSDGGDVGSDGGDVGSDGGDVGSDGGDVGSDGGVVNG